MSLEEGQSETSPAEKRSFFSRFKTDFGYKNTKHFIIEWILIALIAIVVIYAFAYDIPDTKKSVICWEYYKSLDPSTDMAKKFDVIINRIPAFNSSLAPSSYNP